MKRHQATVRLPLQELLAPSDNPLTTRAVKGLTPGHLRMGLSDVFVWQLSCMPSKQSHVFSMLPIQPDTVID